MDYTYEREAHDEGFATVCGVDEAGRGPLAGPVFAAAVILPENYEHPVLNDSKQLSPKKREAVFDDIVRDAVTFCIASADVEEIDRLNILNATFLAMQRAVSGLLFVPDLVIVDGDKYPHTGLRERVLIKGDAKCMSVAAASVLAKVSRDRLMVGLDEIYPQYGFAVHKGYGTKMHYERIMEYGICDVHRRTFLKNLNKHFEGEELYGKSPDRCLR